MKRILPLLLFSLTCPLALAGDVSIEILGTIDTVDGFGGPGFPAAVGDPIVVRFEIGIPGVEITPGVWTNYTIDQGSFSIETTADTGLQLQQGTFFLQDDDAGTQPFDGFGLIGVQLGSGQWLSLSAGMDTTFLAGHQAHENLGSHPIPGNFAWQGLSIQVGAATVGAQLQSLSITALPGGTVFCDPALANSTGQATNLEAQRLEVPGAGWHLEAEQGPPGQAGYLLVGSDTQSPGLLLGQGRLCLDTGPGAAIGRYHLAGTSMDSLGTFDANGRWTPQNNPSVLGFGFDLPGTLPFVASPTITTGSQWHFQLWHRDVAGSSNLSNGITLAF